MGLRVCNGTLNDSSRCNSSAWDLLTMGGNLPPIIKALFPLPPGLTKDRGYDHNMRPSQSNESICM
jgi:hypothetical protein